jgi:hypothetical protein
MEARVALEDRIARHFVRDGSSSTSTSSTLQPEGRRGAPERVVVLEASAPSVEGVVDEHGGRVLNSNGDEVMAFFASADAPRGARAMLAQLPAWNAAENRRRGRPPAGWTARCSTGRAISEGGAGRGILLEEHLDAPRGATVARGVATKDGIEAFALEEALRDRTTSAPPRALGALAPRAVGRGAARALRRAGRAPGPAAERRGRDDPGGARRPGGRRGSPRPAPGPLHDCR